MMTSIARRLRGVATIAAGQRPRAAREVGEDGLGDTRREADISPGRALALRLHTHGSAWGRALRPELVRGTGGRRMPSLMVAPGAVA